MFPFDDVIMKDQCIWLHMAAMHQNELNKNVSGLTTDICYNLAQIYFSGLIVNTSTVVELMASLGADQVPIKPPPQLIGPWEMWI